MTSPLPRKRPTIQDRNALKAHLDCLYTKVNQRAFIQSDPVQFPRRYSGASDIEIAAFLAATVAWGRRDGIIRSCETIFSLMENRPAEYVMSGAYAALQRTKTLAGRGRSLHRTFFEADLFYFCHGFAYCYRNYGSLESLFASSGSVWDGIALFRETMALANGAPSKHIGNPSAGSACKRINLALRWLVRREGPVDMGLWKRLSPADLFIPLDVHVGRNARALGLLEPQRKTNDRKAVTSLTERLREFCPEDPVKYDFALFGLS